MIITCNKELLDFINWLNEKHPCEQEVIVHEIYSLPRNEITIKKNGKVKLSQYCTFRKGLGVYLEGVSEIYIACESLAKTILGLKQNENSMDSFERFKGYTVKDYLLETFAHEYCHHLQYCGFHNINEEQAERWCKIVYAEYKEEGTKL